MPQQPSTQPSDRPRRHTLVPSEQPGILQCSACHVQYGESSEVGTLMHQHSGDAECPGPDYPPRHLFLVAQNIDHLYGDYFTRAVLVAPSADVALASVLEEYPDPDHDDDSEAPVAYADRLSVFPLGRLEGPLPPGIGINRVGPRRLAAGVWVLAETTGRDYDM